MRSILAGLLAGCCIFGLTAADAQAAPSEQCDTQSVQAMAPADVTVAFAAREGAGCRINGYVTTRDPGPNKVLFVLLLPDRFNGRYLYLGVGGAGGRLPELPSELVSKGYALAGSDGGSGAKSSADFSFMSDPAKAEDFMGRGVRVSAQATQQIARTYYRRDKIFRYVSGCSGGGQMGLTNARRFGAENFDGFLVGATPWPVSAYMPHVYRIASRLQNDPGSWIPPKLMTAAGAAILAAYDETDGARDGIIADQRNIAEFDTGLLRKAGFSDAQIQTFELIRRPHDYSSPLYRGTIRHPGYSITDIAGWSSFLTGHGPPPWPGTAKVSPTQLVGQGTPFIHIMADTRTRSDDPALDYWTVGDEAELIRVATRNGTELRYEDPMDFGKLAGSSGKLIVYHGTNDQAMSYLETVAGYEALVERYPGARGWARTFVVPGMLHCHGGVGPTEPEIQLLEALTGWVEKGEQPDSVVAPRSDPQSGVQRTFRLCAEPMRAVLKSPELDFAKAENWECRAPGA